MKVIVAKQKILGVESYPILFTYLSIFNYCQNSQYVHKAQEFELKYA